MNVQQKKIADRLRLEWEIYRADAMPCHMTGLEKAAKAIAQVYADADPKFKKAAFLAIAIKQ